MSENAQPGGKFPPLTFAATLPQDAASPVKPTRDTDTLQGVLRRRTRIWIDGWMEPGDVERLLLMSDRELQVTIESR